MDPTNKPKGPSPHYSLYQREVFRRGGEQGQRMFSSHFCRPHLVWSSSSEPFCSPGTTGRVYEEEVE